MMKKHVLYLLALLTLFACGGDDGGGGTASGGSEYLNVSNVDITGDKTSATLSIQASPNCEWSITCSESWVSNIAPSSGRGSRDVAITLSGVNPSSSSSRVATLTVRNSSGSITRTVILTQAANGEYIEIVGDATQSFSNKADNREIAIRSNTHWTVSVTGNTDWITVTPSESDNDGRISVSVKDNTTNEERTAIVTIKGTKGVTKELTVKQSPGTLEFEVEELLFTSKAESREVVIHSNTHWTISITGNTDRITVSPLEGNNDGIITVSVKDNTTGSEQEALITLNGTGGLTDVLKVKQAVAAAPTVSLPTVSNVSSYEATISFSFVSDLPVTSCGICYSTTSNTPNLDNNSSVAATSTSSPVEVKMLNLTPATTYYIRAYVINALGASYSEPTSFSTSTRWPGENDVVTP